MHLLLALTEMNNFETNNLEKKSLKTKEDMETNKKPTITSSVFKILSMSKHQYVAFDMLFYAKNTFCAFIRVYADYIIQRIVMV